MIVIPNISYTKAKDDNNLFLPEVNKGMDGTLLEKRLDGPDDPKNFISYKKADGEIIGILYPVDVKYTDKQGNLKDKSNKIYDSKSSEFKYETVHNDILSFFSENIKNGITTSYGDYSITITPEFIENAVAELKDNKVIYTEIGGDKSIVYEATFNGVKDVIVLKEPNNNYIYEYKIDAGGLIIDEGGIIFSDDRVIGNIGSVVIEDSRGVYTTGAIECHKTGISSEYALSVLIPTDFMNDPETVYPVTIDPVLFLYGGSDYYNNPYFSASTMYYSSCTSGGTLIQNSTLSIGRYSQTNYRRTVIRFPGLDNIFDKIAPYCSSITLDLCRYQAYTGASGIYLDAYPEKNAWEQGVSYTGTQYSSIYNQYYSNPYGRTLLNSGAAANGFTSIQIQNILKNDNYSKNKGILLRLSNEIASLTFYGANTANASYMPRITLSYNDVEADGIISGGIYRLSPCTGIASVSDYSLSNNPSVSISLTDKTVAPIFNYPIASYPSYNYSDNTSGDYFDNSFNGYKSLIQNIDNLYRITYSGYGYVIQRLTDNYYLKCTNSSLLPFSNSDDTLDYTTRWFMLKNGDGYLITHYFYNFLSVENINSNNPYPVMKSFTSGTGILWSFDLYCLDVPYIHQVDHKVCGVACSFMILDWLNINISDYTENTYKAFASNMYADGTNAPENFAFALFKKTFLAFGNYGFYGHTYGQTTEDFCCLNNTAYIYIEHPYNPLTINNGTELDPDYDYSLTLTEEEFFRIIKLNTDAGFPVILNIGGFYADQIFNYNLANGGHYILAIGAYNNPQNGGERIVIADPHYKSVRSDSTQSYAIIDLSFNSFCITYKNNNYAIRSILW